MTVFIKTQSGKDAALQRLNGSGIGLSLFSSKVWATSEIDKGSIFYLELPLVETFAIKEIIPKENEVITPILTNETTTATAQKFRPNILVVEDNPDLRTYLFMILKEDYNVEVVENGKEAVE